MKRYTQKDCVPLCSSPAPRMGTCVWWKMTTSEICQDCGRDISPGLPPLKCLPTRLLDIPWQVVLISFLSMLHSALFNLTLPLHWKPRQADPRISSSHSPQPYINYLTEQKQLQSELSKHPMHYQVVFWLLKQFSETEQAGHKPAQTPGWSTVGISST